MKRRPRATGPSRDDLLAELRRVTEGLQHEAQQSRQIQVYRERLRAREAELAAERAESRAKDRFIAMLSHELRNPLTPVLLTVQIVERGLLRPEQLPAAMAVIRRNVEQEVRLVDDLLDVTRIAHGKIRLSREPLDLHEVIEDVVGGRLAEIERAGLTSVLDLRAERRIVAGDAIRLRQVVWNLVNNAICYTPPGGRIVVRTGNPRPDVVHMRVEDTGEGIAPDMLERIFEPFDQVPGERGPRGGLGLGLTICKALVEAHGGHIAAQSPGRGRGATFVVRLAASVAAGMHPGVRVRRAAPTPARALRILLVEDDRDSADAIAAALRLRGHDVTMAHRVHEALSVEGPSFDVLVSDLSLPDGTGLELMRAFARRGRIRGVAVSGFGTAGDVQRCRDAGFAHHLTKPVHIDALVDVVETAVG